MPKHEQSQPHIHNLNDDPFKDPPQIPSRSKKPGSKFSKDQLTGTSLETQNPTPPRVDRSKKPLLDPFGNSEEGKTLVDLYNQGKKHNREDNHSDALVAFETLIEHDQTNPEHYFQLAYTHLRLGNDQQSLDLFTSLLTLCDPDNPNHKKIKEDTEAISIIIKQRIDSETDPKSTGAESQQSTEPQTIFQRPHQETSTPKPKDAGKVKWEEGKQAFEDKRYPDAVTAFKKAHQTEQDPKIKKQVLQAAANMFLKEGDTSATQLEETGPKWGHPLDMYKWSVEFDPENPMRLFKVATSLHNTGQDTDALIHFNLALKNCKNPELYEAIEAKQKEVLENIRRKEHHFDDYDNQS